jgi:hypothetical protein
MVSSTQQLAGPSRSARLSHSFIRSGLLLAIALLLSLTATAKAQAADCMTADECVNSAQWLKGIANDYNNKAAWFRATSRQNFINAYEWNQKATFAFHAGDATAATWYKAIADDYSRKAVADAKAADSYANQATFYYAAYNNNISRGMFIAGGVQSFADYPADPGDVDGTCTTGDLCTAGTHKTCKKHPLDTYWHPKVAGKDVYQAHVYTMWCFKNGVIVSRHTTTDDHHITDWGHLWSYEIDNGPDKKRSYCNADMTACFTRYQYGFRGAAVSSAGGCIETWIFGSGYHHRNTYGGSCKDDWPI